MKPNDPHHWTITVHGKPQPRRRHIEQIECIGDIEHALQRADELESNVEFEVIQFVITRGAPAPAQQPAR